MLDRLLSHDRPRSRLLRAGAAVRYLRLDPWTVPSPAVLWHVARQARRLAQLARDLGCDLVYSNTSSVNTGALAAVLTGLPHVWHVREYPGAQDAWSLQRTTFIALASNHLICNSRSVCSRFDGLANPAARSVAYNYVEPPVAPCPRPVPAVHCTIVTLIDGTRAQPAVDRSSHLTPAPAASLALLVSQVEVAADQQAPTRQVGTRLVPAAGWREAVGLLNQMINTAPGHVVVRADEATAPAAWLTRLVQAGEQARVGVVTDLAALVPRSRLGHHTRQTSVEDMRAAAQLLAGDSACDIETGFGVVALLSAHALREVGGLRLSSVGLPDALMDFGRRARARGWRIVGLPGLFVDWPVHPDWRCRQWLRNRRAAAKPLPWQQRELLDSVTCGLRTLLSTWRQSPRQRVLLLGTVEPRKAQHDAIAAMALLRGAAPDAELILAGPNGPDRAYPARLQNLIKNLGLTGRVHRVAALTDPYPLIAGCDISLVCGHEPWGRVAVEAMLCARPVIAADSGGVTEIVVAGQTGLLFEAGNPDALARCIAELLRDPARARAMGEAGRARALALYHVDGYGAAVAGCLKRVIGTGNRLSVAHPIAQPFLNPLPASNLRELVARSLRFLRLRWRARRLMRVARRRLGWPTC